MALWWVHYDWRDPRVTANPSYSHNKNLGKSFASYQDGKIRDASAYVDAQDEADAIAAAHTLWQRDYDWTPPVKERSWSLMWTDGAWKQAEYLAPCVAPVRFYPDGNAAFCVTVQATTFEEAVKKAEADARATLDFLWKMPLMRVNHFS